LTATHAQFLYKKRDDVRKEPKVELLQGTLDMLVLRTLMSGPLHGYDILERIRQLSAEVIRVEEGSLYPSLHRMEERGLILSDWGVSQNNRKARFYRLTRQGRRHLEQQRSSWIRLSEAITKVVGSADGEIARAV
jgi:transcriptional regulator